MATLGMLEHVTPSGWPAKSVSQNTRIFCMQIVTDEMFVGHLLAAAHFLTGAHISLQTGKP